MTYRVLADLLAVFHLGFVLFVCLGGLLVLRWRRVAWIHLPAALWGAIVEFTQTICPLTPLENHLRHLGGEAGYSGGFIEHHITRVLYPAGLSRPIQIALGVFVVILNLAVYTTIWLRRRRESSAL
ncbi:MAG TPA: DUF2784 domain-containing protein [Thermoanaerobaculia bacterium]|jgi:hypothetical protein|nr:DUF2784 domain-containing protein [Thermoanaerobaculia bacterium]